MIADDTLSDHEERTSLTEVWINRRQILIEGLKEMNASLERASRLLADSDRPPAPPDEEAVTPPSDPPPPTHH